MSAQGKSDSNWLSIIIPVVIACAVIAFLIVTSESAPSGEMSTNNISQTETEAELSDQAAQELLDIGLLLAGIQSKQAEFEANLPDYPAQSRSIYTVDADGRVSPQLLPADKRLWDIILSLAPSQQVRQSIDELEVFNDPSDSAVTAVVARDVTNTSWRFRINYAATKDFEVLIAGIIHEYAHIIALQDDQTITEAEQPGATEQCRNYLVAEGCLIDGSYLNQFYNQFWRDQDVFLTRDRTEAEAIDLFAKLPNDFVSDYATINPVEDFAESLRVYVLHMSPEPDTRKAEKVRFFEAFSELSLYRAEVRQTILDW